jgi:hypothetical protein
MSSTHTYKFTSSAVPSHYSNDISILNSLDQTLLTQLLNIVLLYLTNQSNQGQSQLATFTQTHNINFKALNSTVNTLVNILTSALRLNLSLPALRSDLAALGLAAEQLDILIKQWSAAYSSLSISAIHSTLKRNELTNIEWSFGVTAASDAALQVGTTYLLLKLTIQNVNLGKLENITLQLTLPQFYQFLQQMQQADRQVQAIANQ